MPTASSRRGEAGGAGAHLHRGLGSAEGSLIPVPGAGGGTEFVKDANGQFVKSRLDEARLRKIAEATGGFYVHLQTGPAEMTQIVRDGLGKMTEKDIDAKMSRQPIERYQWPLAAGLVLLAASMLIGERRRGPAAARRVAGALLLALALTAAPAEAAPRVAERSVCRGPLRGRAEGLRAAGAGRNRTPRRSRSTGARRLTRTSDFDTALKAFSQALTSNDTEAAREGGIQSGQHALPERRAEAGGEAAPRRARALRAGAQVQPKDADAHAQQEVDRRTAGEAEAAASSSSSRTKSRTRKRISSRSRIKRISSRRATRRTSSSRAANKTKEDQQKQGGKSEQEKKDGQQSKDQQEQGRRETAAGRSKKGGAEGRAGTRIAGQGRREEGRAKSAGEEFDRRKARTENSSRSQCRSSRTKSRRAN